MTPISGQFQSFTPEKKSVASVTVDQVRSSTGYEIRRYSDLIAKLAVVAFENPEFVLLFRGQSRDYRLEGQTTLLPSIYRNPPLAAKFYATELQQRYERLENCERRLYRVLGSNSLKARVGRSELARWAILQHYEICPTPLLDVTNSALVSCSFAAMSQQENPDHAFIFVIGVPQISGSVTVAASHELQVVRLSGVIPPQTLRPYFQEGYLVGTYPSVSTLDEKARYSRSEMDFGQRLIAKFKIMLCNDFWDAGFRPLPTDSLYPNEQQGLCAKIASLKEAN